MNTSDAIISFPIFGPGFLLDPPRSFALFGRPIYFYGVIIAFGFLLAVFYALRRHRSFGVSQDHIIDMLLFAVPIAIICARLYYVFFNFAEYRDNFADIFKIWKGGLAIYGGIIGAVVTVVIFCRIRKIPAGVMLDIGALGLLIGQAVGRWGNFFNREAFGAVTDLPWKMGLTVNGATVYVHPTFLYESLWNTLGFLLLHQFSKKRRSYDGQVFLLYLAWYGLGRFLIEGLRSDSLYLFGTGIRVSQLLAALSFAAAVFLLLWNHYHGNHSVDMLYVNRSSSNPAASLGSATEASAPSQERTGPDITDENQSAAGGGDQSK